ncbi:thymidine phosphorylase family protein [Candidatus Peregrinibacteria bacterium]|nr:thymidine phosphorylase family protein [Candidatus Peregrinibacteria bacterium]
MRLKPKRINIKTGNKYIAVLSENTALKLDLHAGDRIKITNTCGDTSYDITAILDVSEGFFPDDSIGLFWETYQKIYCHQNQKVHVTLAEKPLTNIFIRKKLDGIELKPSEIDAIIQDVVQDDFSDIEMSYFVAGCYTHGLNDNETAALTRSIVKHGSKLTFKNGIVVDKHCIGGVPGNRTTMIVVPIITALGLLMPKTSSRAITSPAGTADTMEVLCNVRNDAKKLRKIIKKTNGFITWGGGVDLAAADDYMIRVRHPLSLDPEGMLLASIMAKKHSVSATHVLIDIPCGPQVKIQTKAQASHLKKRFLKIGKMLGMKVQVVYSDGSEPIGNGIGPLLEALDVIKVLKNEPDAPKDLKTKSLKMAGLLLEMTKKTKKGEGIKKATEVLQSGQAWKQMEKIIEAQGGKKIPDFAPFQFPYSAQKNGKIRMIDNKVIARIARMAGAPIAPQAGLYLHKKLHDTVKKGEKLFTIYASSPDRLKYAVEYALHNRAYLI